MTSPYPRYRDSGVEWLGRIPEHWRVDHLNRSVVKSAGEVEGKQRLQYIGLEHVESWSGNLLPLDDQFVPEGSANSFTTGDILFGKLRPYLAKAFRADFDGLCSTEFLVLTPVAYHESYLLYLLLTPGFVSRVDSSTYGAKMPRANWGFIGDSLLPVPPIGEQRAIAAFIDRETARVDELVGQQEQLLERLAEYRTAVITRTVTEGLPSAASEDASSINTTWRQLKAFCTGVAQYGLNVPAARYAESGIRLIRTSDVTDEGEVREDGAVYVPDSVVPSEYELMNGDLLVSRSGTLGRCLRYRSSIGLATFAGYLIRFRPSEGSDPKYIEYCTHARFFQQAIDAEAPSSTIANFNATRYANTLLPWWPLEIQRAIGQFLDQETARVDNLVGQAELAVERLLEYRSALITHAVSGAIDARTTIRPCDHQVEGRP